MVAQEVQKLAIESKEASEKISTRVLSISDQVREAMENIRRVSDLFGVIRGSRLGFLDFQGTNKEFLGRVDTFMADSSGKIAQGAHQMDESVQVMQGATGRFQSMASIISSIVKAQKGLKDIRL